MQCIQDEPQNKSPVSGQFPERIESDYDHNDYNQDKVAGGE